MKISLKFLVIFAISTVFANKDCSSPDISLEESCICRLHGENTSRIDPCPASTCAHGTLTFNRTESRLKCLCEENFEGIRCQMIYCKYGHRINENTCECESGFKGQNCREMDCQNEGTSIVEKGWTKCRCQEGFAGKRCESKVPDCGKHGKVVWVETSDFVREKLLEVDPNKKLMCHCDQGYGGELCQDKLTCKHGKLFDTGCACNHQWGGEHCDVPICEHGTRIATGCVCEFGWGGRFCDSCLWGKKDGDICVQYAYSTPMKEEIRSDGPHLKMSWAVFILILILCSIAFLAVGCWFQPRRHLGVCFPSLRYTTPPEQNDVQMAVNPRVVVVQDSGTRQIVVNVVPRDKTKDSLSPSKNGSPSSGKNSNNNNNDGSGSSRRHSTGSRPPSYTKVAQEEEEPLPTYRDATSYREAMRRAQSDGVIINFIDD